MAFYKYELSICAMYKNEAKHLLEWLEYHRMIGVEHFYLYNNLSTDDHTLLEPYMREGIVNYHDYNVDIPSVHWLMHFRDPDYPYNHCVKTYAHESCRIAFIDIDEFIVVRSGEDLKKALLKYGEFPGLAINWLCFGSSNNYTEPDKLVLESYFLRPPRDHPDNECVKSIVNPRHVKEWHSVHIPTVDGTILRPDLSPCIAVQGVNLCTQPVQHDEMVVFHYRRKSKEYCIFTKIGRLVDLKILKTPIVNSHQTAKASSTSTTATSWIGRSRIASLGIVLKT